MCSSWGTSLLQVAHGGELVPLSGLYGSGLQSWSMATEVMELVMGHVGLLHGVGTEVRCLQVQVGAWCKGARETLGK